MTDEHECHYVCEECGENSVLDATGIDYDAYGGPTGLCMPCGEHMRYVCKDSVEGKCPVEREGVI